MQFCDTVYFKSMFLFCKALWLPKKVPMSQLTMQHLLFSGIKNMETYTPAETPKPKQESEGRSFWEGGKQESILESRDDSEDTDVENQGILAFIVYSTN